MAAMLGLLQGFGAPALLGQNTLSRAGMHLSYQVDTDSLTLTLQAPTTGWLAVGFNSENQILGSDLKMMAMIAGQVVVEDQFVRALGDHPKDQDLGGENQVRVLAGQEKDGHTSVRLRLPLSPADPYDQALVRGQKLWVILAFSEEDDFDHHSRVREHLPFEP